MATIGNWQAATESIWKASSIDCIDHFKSLKDEIDKIAFMHKMGNIGNVSWLQFYMESCEKLHLKSPEKSTQHRNYGNKLFQEKKYKDALEFYTQSVMEAPDKTRDLGLAYGNHSAVCFYLKLYQETIESIKLALDNQYPEPTSYKLYLRWAHCLYHTGDMQQASEKVNTAKRKFLKIKKWKKKKRKRQAGGDSDPAEKSSAKIQKGPPTDVTEEFDINENVVNVTNSTTKQSTCSSLSAPDNVSSLNLSSNALSPEAHKLLIEQQFPNIEISKIHNYSLCKSRGCSSFSSEENRRQSTLKEKCDHSWLNSNKLSYCQTTRLWNFTFIEGDGLYCILCKKHDMKNPRNKSSVFSQEASKRFRKGTLYDHIKCQKHQDAKSSEVLNRVSVFQKEIEHKESVNQEILYQVFYSFFFLAKESIANCKIVQFLKFIEYIGLNDLKYFTHRSVQSRRDILLKLSDTVQNNLLEKLHNATSYGLLIDDMSDVATMEQMICYVQYVDPDSNEVNTDFLFICNLLENSESANSQTLFDVLCMKLKDLQMDVKKISGLCTDGASVMVGKKDGLASKLKKENSSLIAVHCICHRLALACTDTNVKLKSIGNVEQIMLQLWKLFHYSPKKMALFLKHLQNYRNLIINTSIEEKCCKILKKACKTRWLSFDASIQAVWEELVPVVQTLSAISESDATAYGLLKRMNSTIFVGIVYILKEILPVLARVSKIFQRGYFNFSSIQPTLECTQGELQHISDNLTPIKNLEKDIQSDGRLGLLALELKDGTKTNLQHTLENYVQSLIDNISKRFPDVAILSALGIFNPVIIPDKKSTEFMNYGASSLETIFAHFYSNDEDITIDECLAEWNLLKYHLIKMKPDIPSQCELDSQLRTSTEWCLRQIVLKRHEYKHVCPHLSNIAEIVLTVPVSNAWPERGCSKVKIIKTDLRNRLKNDVLNGLMMISINGPQTCSHECDKVVNDSVKLWLGEKNRRKLPSKNKGQVKLLEEIKLLDENIAKNRSYETTEGNKEVQPELFHDRDTVLTQASSAVTMKYDKDRGRYLQATCKIPAGSVIIAEKPFATVLLPDHYQTHCHHCIGQLTAVVPCRRCSTVLYCSETCRQQSWSIYHQIECQYLDICHSIGIAHLSLRIVLTAGLQHLLDFRDKMSASEFYQKEDRIGGVTEEGTYDKTYLSVYDLMTHALDIETADSFQYTFTALLLLTILKKSGWLEKKSGDVKITNDNTEDITKLQFSQDDLYIGGLLLRHIEQLVCNAHAITELQVTQTSDTSLVDSKSQERVATAIYPTTSLLNHSCDPSIIPGFDKDKLVVRVIKDVEAGEEIFNCYGPHHKRMSKMERQQALKTQYFFTCQCPSCQAYDEQDILRYCCPLCKAALKENETTCSCTACDFTDHVTMFLTNENTAKNMFIDGLKCLQIQDIEGTIQNFTNCLNVQLKVLYKHHKSLAETKDCLAQCYALSKKYNKAIPYLRDSVCTLGKLYGDTSIEYANELHKFAGVLYYAEGFLEEGLAVTDKAVQIFTLHCGNKYELVQELEEMKICMLDKLKIE